MLSKQAEEVKKELMKNKDISLEYMLKTPLDIQRKEWEDSVADAKLPQGILVEKVIEKDISAEWVTKKNIDKKTVVLYFHGGGNNQGSSITHRKLVSHIAYHTNLPILIHNYPLAPENPFPAALDSSKKAYLWLLDNEIKPENIIFGGDSSGGGLALSTMLLLKDEHYSLPKAAFLLSPMLDFALSGNTINTYPQSDPCVFEEDLQITANYYCSGESPYNPHISPIYGEFDGFPPLLIQVGSNELLFSDSKRLAEKTKASGVDVKLDVWNGMWHVFQSNIENVPEAEQAIKKIGEFIHDVLIK